MRHIWLLDFEHENISNLLSARKLKHFQRFHLTGPSEMNGKEFFLRFSSPAEEIYLLFDFKRRNKITSREREEAVPIS